MPPRPLPTDRQALAAIVDEAEAAERAVSARLASLRHLETVSRQRKNPIFAATPAAAYLDAESLRLTATLAAPPPALHRCGPLIELPPAALAPDAYLAELRRELIRLRRRATAALADGAEPEGDAALAATLAALAGSRRGIEVVGCLAGREGRSASLDEIAEAVYGCRRTTEAIAARKLVRTQLARLAERLDLRAAPLRLRVAANRAFLDPG